MAKLWALADLHLSLSGDKPMEIFGENWKDHPARMAAAWDGTVQETDTVLLPGDLSWAMNLEGAAEDLRWIGERPGRKIVLKGNHDYWWSSLSKVREALPPGCQALQNDSFRTEGGAVVVGARGWVSPDDPIAGAGDEKIFRREMERLRLSVEDADRRFGRESPRIAMLHYPPWIREREPTRMVEILAAAEVSVCVFGHLHGEDHSLAVTGERDGIRYMLVSADAVDFSPVEVAP
jgi:predicted phosphohydrolase